MKLRFIAVLLTLTLILSTFSGCGLLTVEARLDAAEDAVEHRVDQVEEKVESTVRDALTSTPDEPRVSTKETAPAQNTAEAALTAEEAQAIALEHAGLNADEVDRLHTEYEIDDGVPHYDVQFHKDYLEYEYEIHAETGTILSYDRDN